jgi:hypothetical protein
VKENIQNIPSKFKHADYMANVTASTIWFTHWDKVVSSIKKAMEENYTKDTVEEVRKAITTTKKIWTTLVRQEYAQSAAYVVLQAKKQTRKWVAQSIENITQAKQNLEDIQSIEAEALEMVNAWIEVRKLCKQAVTTKRITLAETLALSQNAYTTVSEGIPKWNEVSHSLSAYDIKSKG